MRHRVRLGRRGSRFGSTECLHSLPADVVRPKSAMGTALLQC